MTERDVEHCLMELLDAIALADPEDAIVDIPKGLEDLKRVETYEDAGMLTGNAGLVLRTRRGDEFQVTIVKSR